MNLTTLYLVMFCLSPEIQQETTKTSAIQKKAPQTCQAYPLGSKKNIALAGFLNVASSTGQQPPERHHLTWRVDLLFCIRKGQFLKKHV